MKKCKVDLQEILTYYLKTEEMHQWFSPSVITFLQARYFAHNNNVGFIYTFNLTVCITLLQNDRLFQIHMLILETLTVEM